VSQNAVQAPPPSPPAPPAPPADIAAGSDLSYGNRPQPSYPPQAVRQHHTGTVTLLILVGLDGVPKDVKVEKSSGFHELDKAAMDAVQKWRFNPEVKNGKKVEGYARVPINFNLAE
jgi:protein TonB